jgi:hypothetical protein
MSPNEKAEARAAAESLRSSLSPASRAEIVAVLLKLRQHYPEKDRPEGVWQSVIADYATDLGEYPADIVTEGATAYRRAGKWWPKVSELIGFMEPLLAERRNMLARAEKLAAGGPEKPSRYTPGPEERKRIADGFLSAADILRNMPGPGAA